MLVEDKFISEETSQEISPHAIICYMNCSAPSKTLKNLKMVKLLIKSVYFENVSFHATTISGKQHIAQLYANCYFDHWLKGTIHFTYVKQKISTLHLIVLALFDP